MSLSCRIEMVLPRSWPSRSLKPLTPGGLSLVGMNQLLRPSETSLLEMESAMHLSKALDQGIGPRCEKTYIITVRGPRRSMERWKSKRRVGAFVPRTSSTGSATIIETCNAFVDEFRA